MDIEKLKKIIDDISNQKLSREKALKKLKELPYQDLGFAKIDHHRFLRKGFPEVVFGSGKTQIQLVKIIQTLHKKSQTVLVTRIEPERYRKLKTKIPVHKYYRQGHILLIGSAVKKKNSYKIPVLTGGTADIMVAEEVAAVLEAMGNTPLKIYDVGTSGIHRLFDKLDMLEESRVIVVVAGMDGILPTVVGGLVRQPVIAVPTSTGYGTSFNGVGPLITMLNSCAPGVVVVNIDNGFGAAYAASLINQI
ncbi:nickel pincer cofactor biosynthesis protein LarB [Elusimicrobiota bacterium]